MATPPMTDGPKDVGTSAGTSAGVDAGTSAGDAPGAATAEQVPSYRTSCPSCGRPLAPQAQQPTTICACGYAVSTKTLEEAEYLRYGIPMWRARLAEIDAQHQNTQHPRVPAVVAEGNTLREGLPTWTRRLEALEQQIRSGRPVTAAGGNVSTATESYLGANSAAGGGSQTWTAPVVREPREPFSAYRLVLALGALMLIAGTAAYSFQLGTLYGPYAQLTALLVTCALSGAATIYARDRVQATTVALSAITAGAWFFTMVWFGYKIEGPGFWRLSSPLSIGLAAATAIVFYFAGTKARIGFWDFIRYVSLVLVLVLTLFYAGTQWMHANEVSPAVINAIITIPLSLLGVLLLQQRLPIYRDQRAARLTTGWVASSIAAATAVVSLTYFLQSDNNLTFATTAWRAGGLMAWGLHVYILSALLYTAPVRNVIASGVTAMIGGIMVTGGAKVIDNEFLAPRHGVLTAAAAITISIAASLLLGRPTTAGDGTDGDDADHPLGSAIVTKVNERDLRLALSVIGLIMEIGFLATSIDIDAVSYSALAWLIHLLVIGSLLAWRARVWPATVALGIALGLVGGVTCVPAAAAALIFTVAVLVPMLLTRTPIGRWPLPAISGLFFGVLYTNVLQNAYLYSAPNSKYALGFALLAATSSIAVLMRKQREAVAAIPGAVLAAWSLYMLVGAAGLSGLESVTIPIGLATLIFGFLAWRIQPTLNSAIWLSPAAFISTLPSAIKAVSEPAGPRLYFVVLAVVACLVIGLLTNLSGLMVPGAIGTVLVSLQPLVNHNGGGAPFISLLAGGFALISVGWKYERLRNKEGFKSLK